jgi:hypothetical protein
LYDWKEKYGQMALDGHFVSVADISTIPKLTDLEKASPDILVEC